MKFPITMWCILMLLAAGLALAALGQHVAATIFACCALVLAVAVLLVDIGRRV